MLDRGTASGLEPGRVPTWFGPTEAPLLGWWHLPSERRARAVVILCPPIGLDYFAAHRAYRLLAQELAARDLAALTFDYFGTGDSAGSGSDVTELRQWTEGIGHAITAAKQAGAPSVILVGMRMGALLAAQVAEESGDVDHLVLWDPCSSGRSYLRAQRSLHLVSHPTLGETRREDGAVEIPGVLLSAGLAAELSALPLAPAGIAVSGAVRTVLLVLREGHGRPELAAAPDVTVASVRDQGPLLDVPKIDAVMPRATISLIADRLAAVAPVQGAVLEPVLREVAALTTADGSVVHERVVWMSAGAVVGVVTEPATPTGGLVILPTTAATHHVGPARLWVELARGWANSGHRVVRFDNPDMGDSPGAVAVGVDGPVYYSATAVSSVVAAAEALDPDETRLRVVVGLCSGAWAAVCSAASIGATAVYPVNLIMWESAPRPRGLSRSRIDTVRRRLHLRARGLAPFRSTVVWSRRQWQRIGRVPSPPERLLITHGPKRTRIRLLMGLSEAELMQTRSGTGSRRRIAHASNVEVLATAALDHTLLTEPARREATVVLTAWLSEDLPARAPAALEDSRH